MDDLSDKPRIPRVLVITASVGAGHNQVAKAAREGLDEAGIASDLIEVLTLAPWWFRVYYAGGFALSMGHLPWFYGLGYSLSNHPQGPSRGLMERSRMWLERKIMHRFVRRILDERPEVVVCTHFLPASIIGWLIDRGLIDCRLFVTVTDFEVHRLWFASRVDRWFTPAEFTREPFGRWGIAPERITFSGMVIQAKWTLPVDRAGALREWSLPADRPIVLLSGGTEFTIGPVAAMAESIAKACPCAVVVVLAGRNKKLLGRLAKLSARVPSVRAVSFTDRVHELVEVCSLMVTKAGGLTTSECLARGKAMVLLPPVPGHEAGNAAYFEREGAGVIVHRLRDLPSTVAGMLADSEALEQMGVNARRLYRPGRESLVSAVRQALTSPSPGRASADGS